MTGNPKGHIRVISLDKTAEMIFFFAWKNNFIHVLVFKEAGWSTKFPSDLHAIFSHLVNKNSKTLEI